MDEQRNAIELGARRRIVRVAVVILLAGLVAPTPAHGGFTWFTDAVNVNPGTTGSWQDIDLSAIVPAGATGVIIEFDNTGSGTYRAVVRGKEDTREYMSNASYNTIKEKRSRFQIVKLDANRFIEGYISNQNVDIWLRGYTTGGDPSYFTEPSEITLSAGSWQTIDVSGQVDAGANGVILFITSQDSSSRTYAIREIGGSDQQTPAYGVEQYGSTMYLVGVDGAKQFEANIEATSVKIYLVAQTKGSVVYNRNDTVLPDISNWVDRDADDFGVPEGANGLIFYSYNTSTSNRRNQAYFHGDSTQTYRGNLGYQGPNATQSATGLNDANVWKQFQEANTIDAFIAAYTTGGYRMATGSYTGDGINGRGITGVGFGPDVVFVKKDGAKQTYVRTSTMSVDASKEMASTTSLYSNRIESLDSNGFTLGSNGDVNGNNADYTWIAFRAGAAELHVDSYTGNGNDNHNITGVGFQPDYLIVIPADNYQPYQRFSSMSGDTSVDFSSGATTTNRIQLLQSDGFQVGSSTDVNANNKTYHYVAWKTTAGQAKVASYSGNGSDDRSIPGVGFLPRWVVIKGTSGNYGVHRPWSLAGDATQYFTGTGKFSDGIQAFELDGFQVGTDATVNTDSTTYHWAAFTGPGFGVPTLTLANHDAGQQSDAFTQSGAETNAELFGFNLDPGGDTIAVTELVFRLSNVSGLTNSDWTFGEIVVDDNGDGDIFGSENTTVGGAEIVDQAAGTITFSTSFSVSSATNYILRFDFTSLSEGDTVRIALSSADITTAYAVSGSASAVTHSEITPTPGSMAYGTYTGNGTSQSITGVGFPPDVVIIKGNTNKNAFLRSSTMTDDLSKSLVGNPTLQSGRIQSLDDDGFTVGTNADVNEDSTAYYWVAFKETAGELDVGTYPGDGAPSQSIGGVGFRPNYLIVLSAGSHNVLHHSSTMPADFSVRFSEQTMFTDRIKAFETDGFQVGSHAQVNQSSTTYHYVAFKESAGQMKVGSYTGTGNDLNITDVGFQPAYLILKAEGVNAAHRTSSVTGDATLDFKTVANYADGIKELQTDGFQLGTNTKVNQDTKTYYWMAFANAAASSKPQIIRWAEVDPNP